MTTNYFSEEDVLGIQDSRTLSDLRKVALRVLGRIPGKVGVVCGPITSGNHQTPEQNRLMIFRMISALRREDVLIFNHLLFQRQAEKILRASGGDRDRLRRLFYLPILESPRVATLYLATGWNRSAGSRWWHKQAKRLDKKIIVIRFGSSPKVAGV